MDIPEVDLKAILSARFAALANRACTEQAQQLVDHVFELVMKVDSSVNGTLNLTLACRYRHFESDPSASSLVPRSREQCGQMLSSLSFALLGRARMPARRLSLSR
jgi:hypothetical protein